MKFTIRKTDFKFSLLILLLIIPFFELPLLSIHYPIINSIFKYGKLLSFLLIVIIYILSKKPSKIIIGICCYILTLIISTIINNGDYNYLLSIGIGIISLSLIFEFGIASKKRNVFFKTVIYYILFLLTVNLILMILYPNGMYKAIDTNYTENWLLGYKNSLILYIYPCLLCSFLYSYLNNDKLNILSIVVYIICLISSYIAATSTTLFGLLLIGFYIMFSRSFVKRKILCIKNYVKIYIILYLGIIIFHVQNLFKFLIVDILKKDLTFTGRIYIWSYVINFIKKKPLIGYGIENSNYRFMKTSYWRSFHAHNFILEIVYKTGIVGFAIFSYIIYMMINQLNNLDNKKIKSFLSWFVFVFFIQLLTEAYSFIYIFYIFVIVYNISLIADKSI